MADRPDTEVEPESKQAFWSSLPGIFTGIGGVIVAATGLITALVTTGVIGPNANSNNGPPVNSPVALTSGPSASPVTDPVGDRYKALAGKWRVTEKPGHYLYDTKYRYVKIIWEYDAAVSGNKLKLTGKIVQINEDKNLRDDEKTIVSTYQATLDGSAGNGNFTITKGDEVTEINPASIQFADDLTTLKGNIQIDGQTAIKLQGIKLPAQP